MAEIEIIPPEDFRRELAQYQREIGDERRFLNLPEDAESQMTDLELLRALDL